jgi:tRNA (cmo5U34)-methyltransferase
MQALHFEDPEFVKRYAEGPGCFVPGYQVMQRMAAQLLRERAGDGANILVLGAGGGLETAAFASLEPSWRFVGVDPAKEMLDAAKNLLAETGAADRVVWVRGKIDDAPEGPFDGATCLLALHFVPDDGSKLATLKALRARLKPGAVFVLVDLCMELESQKRERHLDRYRRFALNSGADADDVAATCARLTDVLHQVSPERDEALLQEAGFSDVELFYAGLSWRGWRSSA